MDRWKAKRKLLKRLQGTRHPFENWIKKLEDHIYKDEDVKDWYKANKELLRYANDIYHFLKEKDQKFKRELSFDEVPWYLKLKPKSNECYRKTSKYIFPVYQHLESMVIDDFDETELMYQKHKIDLRNEDKMPFVLTTCDTNHLIAKLDITSMSISNIIDFWVDNGNGPIFPTDKFTAPRNKGGKAIYIIGKWVSGPAGKRPVLSYNKTNYTRWTRRRLFRKK